MCVSPSGWRCSARVRLRVLGTLGVAAGRQSDSSGKTVLQMHCQCSPAGTRLLASPQAAAAGAEAIIEHLQPPRRSSCRSQAPVVLPVWPSTTRPSSRACGGCSNLRQPRSSRLMSAGSFVLRGPLRCTCWHRADLHRLGGWRGGASFLRPSWWAGVLRACVCSPAHASPSLGQLSACVSAPAGPASSPARPGRPRHDASSATLRGARALCLLRRCAPSMYPRCTASLPIHQFAARDETATADMRMRRQWAQLPPLASCRTPFKRDRFSALRRASIDAIIERSFAGTMCSAGCLPLFDPPVVCYHRRWSCASPYEPLHRRGWRQRSNGPALPPPAHAILRQRRVCEGGSRRALRGGGPADAATHRRAWRTRPPSRPRAVHPGRTHRVSSFAAYGGRGQRERFRRALRHRRTGKLEARHHRHYQLIARVRRRDAGRPRVVGAVVARASPRPTALWSASSYDVYSL